MLLVDYLNRHYLASRPGLSGGYRALLGATVRKLCAWTGQPLELTEVDRPLLSAWASHLLQTGRPATVNNKLRMVRSLLLAAYDDGLLDKPPRRVRRVPENHGPPVAWTIDEVRQLLNHLDGLGGFVGYGVVR